MDLCPAVNTAAARFPFKVQWCLFGLEFFFLFCGSRD